LIVVVDTHKPAMVAHTPLLKATDHVVVIDHHRRGEDFINQPVLVYMEPYASSTAELVTELIEYQPKQKKLNALEATTLLRSEEHTSELQSRFDLVCRLLLE